VHAPRRQLKLQLISFTGATPVSNDQEGVLAMPLYFFSLEDGRKLSDDLGEDLADDAAAHAAGQQIARELARNKDTGPQGGDRDTFGDEVGKIHLDDDEL
jgi:hypothetical protein